MMMMRMMMMPVGWMAVWVFRELVVRLLLWGESAGRQAEWLEEQQVCCDSCLKLGSVE